MTNAVHCGLAAIAIPKISYEPIALTQNLPSLPTQEFYSDLDLGSYDFEEDELSGPSLPIILISAASAVGLGILSFFISYELLRFRIELSAGIATLCLFIIVGALSSGLSALVGSRAAMSNLGFGCGLIMLMMLFFSLCLISGAFAAMLLTIASS